MAQGRKATPRTTEVAVEVNTPAIAHAGRALTAMSQEALQIQQMFDLKSLDPDTLEAEISIWVEATGRTILMIGARLVALRVVTAHGDWLPRLERLGMAPRAAQKFMAAALKCVSPDGTVRENLMHMGRGKVLELVTLDDAQLDELNSTGRISKLALEMTEIDRLSVSELRNRLKESEQSIAAKDKLIASKDRSLNKLTEQLERPFKATPESEAQTAEEQALLEQIRDCVTAAEAALMQLASMTAAVFSRGNDMSEGMESAAHTAIEYLAQRTADVITASGTRVQFEEIVTPRWIQSAKSKAKK